MDETRLADVLSQLLKRIVPPGVHIQGGAGGFWLFYDGEGTNSTDIEPVSFGAQFRINDVVTAEEQVRITCESVLADLQTFLVRVTGSPWPGEHLLPEAHAVLVDRRVELYYGYPNSRVLDCGVIDLA